MIRGIIFDLDGTLGNTLPVVFAALNAVFDRHLGRTFTEAEIAEMFGPSEEGIIARRVQDQVAAFEEFLQEYDRAHYDLCTEPFEGIPEALALLRERGTKLGLVTGKGPRSAEISLRHIGIAHYFDAIRAGSPEGDRKPGMIHAVLAEWGISPEEAAYVGDAVADMRSAREAGVMPIAAAWATTADVERLTATHPDELFTSVEAFIDWARAACRADT